MSKITSYSADYQTFPALFELEPVAGKKVTADFSAPELSSLGGLPLVREYEKSSNRIIERIESSIKDPRREPMVVHSQTEMLRQRIYQIMAGFEDADDCDRLCRDGILKMCAGRSASDGIDLASQPTMTRLENRLSRKELFDIGEAFIDDFIASYNSEPDSIIIDADDTNADTYGAQQLTLFNAYYGEYCHMPLLLFDGRSGKLILPILRPGRGNKAINISGLLKRLITTLRKKWKHTQITVRGTPISAPATSWTGRQGNRMASTSLRDLPGIPFVHVQGRFLEASAKGCCQNRGQQSRNKRQICRDGLQGAEVQLHIL